MVAVPYFAPARVACSPAACQSRSLQHARVPRHGTALSVLDGSSVWRHALGGGGCLQRARVALQHRARWFCAGGRRTGTVKFFNQAQQYGFIIPADGGHDLYVHRDAVSPGVALDTGLEVTYKTFWHAARNKYCATRVESATGSAGSAAAAEDEPARADTGPVRGEAPGSGARAARVPLLQQLNMQAIKSQQEPLAGADGEPGAGEAAKQASSQSPTSQPRAGGDPDPAGVGEAAQEVSAQSPTFQQKPMRVEPLRVPPGLTVQQRLDLMAEQVEQLRLQGAQNQQLLLQGMYAMLQQQVARNAQLERSLLAIADKVGVPAATLDSTSTSGLDPALGGAVWEVRNTEAHSSQARSKDDAAKAREPVGGQETQSGTGAVQQRAADPRKEGRSDAELAQPGAEEESARARERQGEGDGGRQPATVAQEGGAAGGKPEKEAAEVVPKVAGKDPGDGRGSATDAEKGREEGDGGGLGGPSAERGQEPAPASAEEPAAAKRTTHSLKFWSASSFYVAGSFNGWSADSALLGKAGWKIVVRGDAPRCGGGSSRREEFQILGDSDWDKRVFPAGGDHAEVVALRPGQPSQAAESDGENHGHGRNWAVEGGPGTMFRISYDIKAGLVSCERVA